MSEQQAQGADEAIDLNNELKTRREKLAALREQGVAFPNDFRRDHTSDQLHAEFDAKDNDELASLNVEVAVAGRMMTRRVMGKASFVTLQDVGGRIQLYVARDDLPEGVYNEQFKNGTSATSSPPAASCSKRKPANSPSTAPSCVC
jgi:lysyl-tRNA synthetase class 2